MTSLRERNKQRTRADIEEAALELFGSRGYDATTVDEIATRAGVSSATFFRYFAAKEEVLFSDAERTAAAFGDALRDRLGPRVTFAELGEGVAAYAAGFAERGDTHAQQLTRLALTTRSLEARSVRIRLEWEKTIARERARAAGRRQPSFDDILVAGAAVTCLMTALRAWDDDSAGTLARLVRRAFRRAAQLTATEKES